LHAAAPVSSPLTVMLGKRGSTASAAAAGDGSVSGVRVQAARHTARTAVANTTESRIARIFLHNVGPERYAGR
jgi:hypothetical protein